MKLTVLFLLALLTWGCAPNKPPTSPEPLGQPEPIDNPPLGTNLPRAEVPFPTVNSLWFPDSVKLQFNQLALWAHACPIDPDSCDSNAFIQIDWWQTWEVDPTTGDTVLIYEEKYDAIPLRGLNKDEGGVYVRYPRWYANDDHYPMDYPISAIAGGYLFIYPMKASRGICHWWMPRQSLKRHCGYLVKVRCKISGNVALQLGLDFWKQNAQWQGNDVNNIRSWNSDWYGVQSMQLDSSGELWVIIVPLYLFP